VVFAKTHDFELKIPQFLKFASNWLELNVFLFQKISYVYFFMSASRKAAHERGTPKNWAIKIEISSVAGILQLRHLKAPSLIGFELGFSNSTFSANTIWKSLFA
jgi:hypothetical protein